MATTTNYGWTTPDDTNYVKDGASAIRTLGSAIDSTLLTQITAQIPDSLLTTTGDTIYASGASTPARLGVGSTGQVLTVAGGVPTWAASQGSALTIASIASGSINTGTSLTISSLTQDYLQLQLRGVTFATTNGIVLLQINGSSSAVYDAVAFSGDAAHNSRNQSNGTSFNLESTRVFGTASNIIVELKNCKSTGFTTVIITSTYATTSGTTGFQSQGIFKTAAQVTSLVITNSSGTAFTGTGTYALNGG